MGVAQSPPPLQIEVLVRCPMSPYQQALTNIIAEGTRARPGTGNGGEQFRACLCPSSSKLSTLAMSMQVPGCSIPWKCCASVPHKSSLLNTSTRNLPWFLGGGIQGVAGVNNVVMELRTICNHPLLRFASHTIPWPCQRLSGRSCLAPPNTVLSSCQNCRKMFTHHPCLNPVDPSQPAARARQ